jgi:hypothetical protein
MLTITPAPATTLDAAITALVNIGSLARKEAEDGYPDTPDTVAAIERAFATAERVGVPEDVAYDAYQRGYDWGEA